MTKPEPYRLSAGAVLSGVDSFTWSDDESIAYEVAIENITEASGWYVAKLQENVARTPRIRQWSNGG